jgi:type I restriction enzyme S subunit
MTSVEQVKIPEGYKQTEVGVIPDDWNTKNIGSCLSIRHGRDQKQVQCEDGAYPILGTGGEMGRSNTYIYDKPSVLIGRKGSINKPRFMDTAFWTVDTLFYSEVDSKYSAKYLFYKFCMIDWMGYNEASGVPSLNASTIEGVLISCPDNKYEQTAIANALSDVDKLIASLETLIAKKSAIKTAAMQQLLTGKKRLPAFVKESEKQGAKQSSELDNTSETAQAAQAKKTSTLNSDLYKESSEVLDSKSNQHSDVSNANNKQTAPRPGYKQTELGEIPEDWEVDKLGDLVSITSGESPSKFVFVDSGIPYFKVEQLNNHKKYAGITEYYLKASNTVEEGSIVFPKRGASILLNKIRIFKKPSFMDTNLMALTCSDELSNEFLFYYLNYKGLDSVADTTSIPQINNKHITPFLVPLIKKEEQAAIAKVLSDMDTELDGLQQRLSKTQKIKQGMMQELLTGKTRLISAARR